MPSFCVASVENIMIEEIEAVIKSTKAKKATGPDGLSTEILKALDEQNVEVITGLCNIIGNSDIIPKDLKYQIFVTLPRKNKNIRLLIIKNN